MPEFPYRRFPCNECPFRLDAEPGRFPLCNFERQQTIGDRLDEPMFGCHKGDPATGADLACAGWLAVVGREHLAVRLACAVGDLPVSALDPAPGWPALHPSYRAMLAAERGVAW